MALDKDIYDAKVIQSRISKFKNNLITVKSYYNHPELQEQDAMNRRIRMGEVYDRYVKHCFKSYAMDFDDLLLKTNELFTRFPDVLEKYQQQFKYIMVDEYQDTNHSQYLIVKALSRKFKNICVVGDDAQSIYSFRGANIQNIFNFKKDYPQAKILKLEQNYRSTSNIVNAANCIIKNNFQQLEKDIFTDNKSGDKIQVFQSITDNNEGIFISKSIYKNKLNAKLKYNNFAVLYRTNAQSRPIEDALRKLNIPYRVYGGLSFYQRKEIKDALAYLKVTINTQDEEALKRIINYPTRGIGDTTLDKLTLAANHYNKSIFEIIENIYELNIGINAGTAQKLSDFIYMIKGFQNIVKENTLFESCKYIFQNSGLIHLLHQDKTPKGISKYENLQELLNSIKDFQDKEIQLTNINPSLTNYLENTLLASDIDKNTQQDEVSLMTIHMSKGLEYPIVYIAGMEEDLFPSKMSMTTREDLEEERRLFYVALTRAEKKIYLTFANTRYKWGKLVDRIPSRFLNEIDQEYLNCLNFELEMPKLKSCGEGRVFGNNVKIRLHKPQNGTPPKNKPIQNKKLRITKPNNNISTYPDSFNSLDIDNIVEHNLFGIGKIIELQGRGNNKIAKIDFPKHGIKKLLLRFTKLKIIK